MGTIAKDIRAATIARVTVPAPPDRWRLLFESDPVALPDQSPEFTSAACTTRTWRDVSRLYEFEDGRAFVLPLLRRRWSCVVGSMPPACGIGGLVGPSVDAAVAERVAQDLRQAHISTRIRPNPLLAGEWETIGASASTIPMSAHVADLAGGVDAVWARMRKSGREGVKRARKAGLEITIDTTGALLPEYRTLMGRSVERWARQQNEPRLVAAIRARRRDPDGDLEAMAASLGNRFRLIIARDEEGAVAGNIVLLDGNAHGIRAHMDKERAAPSRINYLLVWLQMEAAAEAGCRWFHMGESGSSRSIAAFKERFGATAYPYAGYHVERLPISRADMALRTACKRMIGFED